MGLILNRQENETVRIGDDVEIRIHKTRGRSVTLDIRAPKDVRVIRGELTEVAKDAKHVKEESKSVTGREALQKAEAKDAGQAENGDSVV